MPLAWLDPAITVGKSLGEFVIGKLRNYATKRLKEGDVQCQQIRDVLITELREINSKLDAFAYRELKSSISFMKDGLNALEMAIGESPDDLEDQIVDSRSEVCEGAILAPPSGRSIILSESRLAEAKRWFEAAIIDSTRAFHNTGLTIEDIIMACRLRIISRVCQF